MKTLKITEKLHKEIELFCVKNYLKINSWVENELKRILDANDTNR